MKIPNQIICRVEDKVIETYLIAERLYGCAFELPSIRWDLCGLYAGRADVRQNVIRFNQTPLSENLDDFLRQTVPHEVAHLVNRTLNGQFVRPHGQEWKSIMQAFGLAPLRCHSYRVENSRVVKQRRHTYRCECREHSISQTTHNRIQKGWRYSCRFCGIFITIMRPIESRLQAREYPESAEA